MSLEVHTDKQDIHTLPRYEGAHPPADAADDLVTDPGSHHRSIQLHAKRRRHGLDI
jgi:hypothetical protein